jgi:hypothetical protein
MFSQALHVRDQLGCGVALKRRVRTRTPAAALIKQDQAITLWIEKPAVVRLTTRARPTVQENRR